MAGHETEIDANGDSVATKVSSFVDTALRNQLKHEFVAFNPHVVNNESVVDNHHDDQMWLQYGILMPIFGAIGILSNLIIFATFSHRNRRLNWSAIPPLSLLLQCLSAYDLLVSLLSVWCFSAPVLDLTILGGDYARQLHPRLLPYIYAALHMAVTGSDYLNLSAAVERYVALDGAFRSRLPSDFKAAGCLPSTTWGYIVGILCGTVAFNLPLAWEREAIEAAVGGDQLWMVVPTALRTNQLYIKLYRLTLEFLVFKATPWFAFLILFLSLRDRVSFYQKRKIRKTLNVDQYVEVLDSRIILGINGLFYATNALPLFVGLCHVFLYDVSAPLERSAYLCLVANSALKLPVYVALSYDFRANLRGLLCCLCSADDGGGDGHWMAVEQRNAEFLGHAKVVTFVQTTASAPGSPTAALLQPEDATSNVCVNVDDEKS